MAVSVHLVTRTRAEVDDAQIEVVARLGRESSVCRVTGPPVNKGAFLRLSGTWWEPYTYATL